MHFSILVRESSFWLHLWDGTTRLCLNVYSAQSDEHGSSVSWMCGQCTGILSTTHGDFVCVVSNDKSTVSECCVDVLY